MIEKRQYVRMNTVFPVEFEIFDETGNERLSRLLQGFTRDVSAGGMCIEFKSFGRDKEELFLAPNARLALVINPPFSKRPVKANARIAWLKKEDEPLPPRYFIGVQYTAIDNKARNRIVKYAKRLIWIPRIATGVVIVVIALAGILFLNNQKLFAQNRLLVNQLVESAEKKSSVAAELFELQKRRTDLDKELIKAQVNIKRLETALASLTAAESGEKDVYEKELKAVQEKQESIGMEMRSIREGREKLKATYQNLETTAQLTASAALRHMYGWLKSHQNLRTGLVASFEGDPALEDWAFTYDQSLACQTFLLFGDIKDAEAILSFYESRAEEANGGFFNTYHTADGRSIESVVHTGPNLWLGIAALQYENKTKNGRFLPLARRIGEWAVKLQDKEGGLKGGPEFSWYSTEHNLDAYAFFSMLAQATQDEKYKSARDHVLDWIKKYAYSVKEKRINRGKGDATIATDTFSWSIAALGPAALKAIEFDPESIIEFAEQNCEVKVSYRLPNGKVVEARGFDFAKAQNIGRGGIISTEWTAQVIVTYRILSDYFDSLGDKEKAALYLDKANFYLSELQKLIITSPSRTGQGRGCLPYASIDNVDTGHGWRTPRGVRTGSVAGTAYGIFAWIGYNPFDLNNKKEIK